MPDRDEQSVDRKPITRQLPRTRYEHLMWCKERAFGHLDQGALGDALSSMLADVGRWTEPIYTADDLTERTMRGQQLVSANDAVGMQRWIESFR